MDVIQFAVFDLLHNVWIGTCKRIVLNIFLERNLLTNKHLLEMTDMCKNILLPIGFDHSSLARKMKLVFRL